MRLALRSPYRKVAITTNSRDLRSRLYPQNRNQIAYLLRMSVEIATELAMINSFAILWQGLFCKHTFSLGFKQCFTGGLHGGVAILKVNMENLPLWPN